MNFIDKTITWVSPQAGLKRLQARLALDLIEKRSFQGASKGERFKTWRRPSTDADSSLNGSLSSLRNSMRDLTRNNPFSSHAVNVIENNVIGSGILGEVISASGRDVSQINKIWKEWTQTTAIDAGDRLNLIGIQSLALRTMVESGEVLIRRRYRRSNSNLPIPVEVQILEPDHLDSSQDGALKNGGEIKEGIEYNKRGKRVAYWLYAEHPGATKTYLRNYNSIRVPASDIIHAFDPKRAGQSRGYPWASSAIKRLKDFDDYEDAQLVRQKIAACYAGFVHDSNASANGSTGLGKDGPEESQEQYMQPGMFSHLPAGKAITLSSPPTVSNYSEYAKAILQGIAAGYGITYEALTGDYGNVNFSSGRLGWVEMGRNVQHWQNQIMIAQIMEGLKKWFMGGLSLIGQDNDGLSIKWMTPKREMMDPSREIPAMVKGIRAGLTSLPRTLASLGMDYDQVIDEIEKSNKDLDDKEIILDSDPRRTNIGGAVNNHIDAENTDL